MKCEKMRKPSRNFDGVIPNGFEEGKRAHPRCKNLLRSRLTQNKENKTIKTRKIIGKKKLHRFLHRGKPRKSVHRLQNTRQIIYILINNKRVHYIVICLVLQKPPTHVNEVVGYSIGPRFF